ncbi:polysaccharide deacetylase family protein [Massilia sp. W12]|uniref:polysaccharide deacetylase family protein n=1 Tax=Massilia sp. W12 TaxID=3126507 RepID=UPI0030D136B3
MKTKTLLYLIAAGVILAVGLAVFSIYHQYRTPAATAPASAAATSASPAAPAPAAQLIPASRELLANYRKIIVLLAEDKGQNQAAQQQARSIGQAIFHDNQNRRNQLEQLLQQIAAGNHAKRHEELSQWLDFVESDPDLFDADRLAFRELLVSLQAAMTRDSALAGIKLHKRIGEDLDALAEIERNYEKEIQQIFSQLGTRSIELKRERWEDYLAKLRKLYQREQIMKEYGYIQAYPQPVGKNDGTEILGTELPPKTVVLTFDDGPHRRYSDEIAAILKQYSVPAVFFSVGRNIGQYDKGAAKLEAGADVSRRLRAAGHALANHSYTHAQLAKTSGETLKAEILNTDNLLKAVDKERAPLFRFPYGARNGEGMQMLSEAKLTSVMWNIDSLDWADPVPESIVERVFRTLEKEKRGIILFHDIHERTVKALPKILQRLSAEGYAFAAWDGNGFKVVKGTPGEEKNKVVVDSGYSNSWALLIGIDDYAKWPKLHYAVRDTEAMRQTLIEKFGFAPEHVITLTNGAATRNGILAAFHERLQHSAKKNDRIFVFYAGHGATVKLSSGRDLGYIIPADADPKQVAAEAIPMTEIQNIAESLSARHVLFVMDACYSGLGLTRGAGNPNFLRENAKRLGRQMLTAGGADQLVADGGPNGHSVFTWALLQGMQGKADLNGDGLITATELAAWVAPSVSAVSQQTPAFGSLPGSEGGDFIFELPSETEFISPQTAQLSNDAIALNSKLAAARPAPALTAASAPAAVTETAIKPTQKPAPVLVKDLHGGEQKITPPSAIPSNNRQLAQRANDRGLQLFKEKQYAKAELEFTEALKLRPDFSQAANNLGFSFYKQDKYLEAARWYEKALQMDPSRAIAWLNLGDALAKAEQKDKARKAYQTYLELAPKSAAAGYVTSQLEKLGA